MKLIVARLYIYYYTVQKIKFFVKYFFSKYGQFHGFLQIWSHLLENSLTENFIFPAACL